MYLQLTMLSFNQQLVDVEATRYFASILKELDNCACFLPHHPEPKGGGTLTKQVKNAGIEPATSEGELTN